MLTKIHEILKSKKKDPIEKVLSTGGKLTGAAIGSRIGAYSGIAYAIGKELYSLLSTQQIYPLTSLTIEYLSIVGAFSLAGHFVGYYLTDKLLDFFSSRSRKEVNEWES